MKLIWIGAAALLCWLLQGMIYQKFWSKGLFAYLHFTSTYVWEGEEGRLQEIVENRKLMPLTVLHVNLQLDRAFSFLARENTAVSDQTYRRDVFALLPYQRITRTLPFIAAQRGYYRCGDLELVGRDLFFHGPFVKKVPSEAFIYVYPKQIPAKQVKVSCEEMLGEYLWRKKMFEDPFSFQGIRDYEPYNCFRQVNWKAYGKTGQLKVNVYEHTAMAKAAILLNLEGDLIWTESLLREGIIRIGAALAVQWITLGVPVEIYTNGRDCITKNPVEVESGAGREHITTILQALSRISAAEEENRGRWEEVSQKTEKNRSLWEKIGSRGRDAGMVLYISCSKREEDLKKLENLRRNGTVVLWILPFVLRQEAIDQQNENRECVYRGSVKKWRIEE